MKSSYSLVLSLMLSKSKSYTAFVRQTCYEFLKMSSVVCEFHSNQHKGVWSRPIRGMQEEGVILCRWGLQLSKPGTSQFHFASTPRLQCECPSNFPYSLGSTFEANLNHSLFDVLPANVLVNGSSQFVAGPGTTDQIYALCYCRGDVSAQDCHDCVQAAAGTLLQKCRPLKEGIVWSEECTLRYSSRSIFSLEEEVPSYRYYNFSSVLSKLDQYQQVFDDTMNGLIRQAASGTAVGRLRGFATEEAELSQDKLTLLGLVQCSPDIVGNPCEKCLRSALKQMDGWATTMIFLPSCNLRFDLYPSQISSPPPVHPPRPNGHLKIIALVVGAFVALLLCGVVYRKRNSIRRLFFPSRPEQPQVPSEDDGSPPASPPSDQPSDPPLSEPPERAMDRQPSASRSYPPPIAPPFFNPAEVPDELPTPRLLYEMKDLREATEGFSDENKIGKGGFGVVYKGTLPNGVEIAVKKLSSTSIQGDPEFKNELKTLTRLQHNNLVKLLGFCLAGNERLLVYEFLPNKSLDKFLFDPERKRELTWSTRYKIIVGIARAILYLHRDSPIRIIHRDLKPANVLLDADKNPKIADFGLARITNFEETHISTCNAAGTFGYMAPELLFQGHFSIESDVYSFGVIVLEAVSGRKVFAPVDQSGQGLLIHAWNCWQQRKPLDLVDATLTDSYSAEEAMRCIQLGLLCAQMDVSKRPTMEKVVRALNPNSGGLEMPQHPMFRRFDENIYNFRNDLTREPRSQHAAESTRSNFMLAARQDPDGIASSSTNRHQLDLNAEHHNADRATANLSSKPKSGHTI